MKKITVRPIVLYLLTFILFSTVFIGLFYLPILKNIHVLFYRGLLFLGVSFCFLFILSLFLRKNISFRRESFIAALVISLSLHLSFFVLFPVTYDRSVTIHILKTLSSMKTNSCINGVTVPELEQNFLSEYVIKKQAIPRRIYEQSLVKNISTTNKCVYLTTTGDAFFSFYTNTAKLFNIDISSNKSSITGH